MATLHALHHQTKELIDFITNESEDAFFECKVEQDLNGELISELRMPSDVDAVTSFSERNLYLVPDEDAGFIEFIIHRTEQADDEFTAYAVGSYVDMDVRKIITPQKYTNKNVPEFGELIFPGTGWQLGVNEFNLYRSVTVEEYEGAYAFLRRVATAFGAELRFRVETSGSRVTGRFVDFLIKEGEDTKKEIELGKDLLGVRVEMDGENIVTELFCVGPERDTGGRLTASVTNEAAFQRWNIDNTHLTHVYYPESDDAGMTREQLIGYGTKELNKRIASVYTYEVTAAVIENEFPHEKTRIGDRVRVKNAEFKPPLYADARIIRIVRYIGEADRKEYVIGEVKTHKESEILQRARMYSKMYASKVLRQPTEPPGNVNHIWIKTGGTVEIPHTWNGIAWQKASPTEAIEIGATTPADVIAEVGQQIDAVEIGTRNLFIARNMLADTYLGSDGTLKPNVGSFTSDKMSVLRMEDITGQTNGRNKYKQFAFYTAADVFIPPLVEYNQADVDYITAKIPANAAWARFSSDDYADGFFKVERGTKATDWTPSPEDAEFKAAAESARAAKAAEDAAKLHADNELKKNSQANQSFIQEYAQTKITQAPTAPTTPGIGNLWIDTSEGKPVWKRWNGTIWELAAMTTLAQLSGYLQDGQITDQFIKSRHIATQSITSEMVVAAGLDAAVIKFGTMSGERIAANSISADKIAATTLSAITANLGNVTAGKIDGVTFTSGIGTGTEYELKDGYARFTNKETINGSTYLREVKLSNGALDARTELNNASFATARLTAETMSMATIERQAMMFIQPDLIEFIAGASNVISVAKNKMYIVPGINYGTIQDNKELRLMGGPSTLSIKDDTLRYNGAPIGFSGSEILWSGAWMVGATDEAPATRRLADCPTGWLLAFSRYTNGQPVDSDWNYYLIPKAHVGYSKGTGIWVPLVATGVGQTVPTLAHKYIYTNGSRITGHARNVTGPESGQCLRYILAV